MVRDHHLSGRVGSVGAHKPSKPHRYLLLLLLPSLLLVAMAASLQTSSCFRLSPTRRTRPNFSPSPPSLHLHSLRKAAAHHLVIFGSLKNEVIVQYRFRDLFRIMRLERKWQCCWENGTRPCTMYWEIPVLSQRVMIP